MISNDLVESYVSEVVRRLPRKIRNDVGYELRALLEEELAGRAAASGRSPDETLTLELLADFGRPSDVADRYRPAGFTIIRPADAPQFARIALGGVALQWVVSIVATFSAPPPGVEWLSLLGSWWVTWGLGAFWWPGLLVSFSVIAGLVATRRENKGLEAPRAVDLDRERVKRGVIALYLALGLAGASIVIALPSLALWGSGLPAPLIDAFEFDEGFLVWRAPWVMLVWLASLGTGIALLVAGRWSRATRRLELAGGVAGIALLAWWVVGGPIFVASATDDVTKLCLMLVGLVLIIDVVLAIRRTVAPFRAPAV